MTKLLARLLTRSFPGNRDQIAAPVIAEESAVPDDTYESRAFADWNELIADRSAAKVLDLGPLRPRALTFFSERSIDLGILNLSPPELVSQVEQFDGSGPYQGLLAWDLLNYCNDAEEFAALGSWLAERLTTGAPALLSLATKTPYGDRPAVYDVVDSNRLRVHPSGSLRRDVLYAGSRLPRLWPEFDVKRSFLLRNGMQEFVLTRR